MRVRERECVFSVQNSCSLYFLFCEASETTITGAAADTPLLLLLLFVIFDLLLLFNALDARFRS